MLFNEWTSDLSEQEIYLMKQVLNSINDKVGQIDDDVDHLKKKATLVDSGTLDGSTGRITIENDLAGADCVLIDIEVAAGGAGTTATIADIVVSNGDNQVASGSIGNALMVAARRCMLHFDKLTDDNFYHCDYGSAATGSATQGMGQSSGGIGHFKDEFDKISITLQSGALFPTGTKYYVYAK